MDIHSLDKAVQCYYSAALAPSTKKTYKAAEKRYLDFCKSFSITPLPTSENILCYYTACLGQQGLSHNTIKTYLSGVRQIQIGYGYPDPTIDHMPRLRQILKGVKVEAGKSGKPTHSRLPITPSILRKMKRAWFAGSHSPYNQSMLWAAAVTTFFSFCRSGEITIPHEGAYDPTAHLSFSDVAVNDAKTPSVISILIKQSKTDQGREGTRVVIGKTGDDLCPVSALLSYLSLRGSNPGPLFRWQNGTALTKPRFVSEVRLALTAANLPAKDFAGHSFRIGATTTSATAGLDDSTIQTLGRWKSASYLLYIRMEPQQLASVSSSLSRCMI